MTDPAFNPQLTAYADQALADIKRVIREELMTRYRALRKEHGNEPIDLVAQVGMEMFFNDRLDKHRMTLLISTAVSMLVDAEERMADHVADWETP